MSNKNSFGIDLDSIGGAMKDLQNAYSAGTDVMDQAGQQVAEDMKPDHQIEISIQLDAKVEGHTYSVDADIIFEIELDPILQVSNSPMGNLSSLLDDLDVDLGDDKAAVMEQLGQPRAVGAVKSIKTKRLEVSDKNGKASVELNKKATLLATIKDKKMLINFEGIFSYPNNSNLFIAIPSMEKMQKNIIINLEKITKKVEFSWIEKDKDNLKIKGKLRIKSI